MREIKLKEEDVFNEENDKKFKQNIIKFLKLTIDEQLEIVTQERFYFYKGIREAGLDLKATSMLVISLVNALRAIPGTAKRYDELYSEFGLGDVNKNKRT